MAHARIRAGVDIGGTFTDVALEVGDTLHTVKVLTTPAAPDDAVLDGLAKAADAAGIALGDIDLVIHGTTLATNALIERRGAKTALLTTRGFRDVIEMRTESRFDQYDLNIVLPTPLVKREDRHPVAGRLAASGRELEPLDEAAVARFADEAAGRYESIAIGFIHSYANPAHEMRARDILAERAPHVSVSLSSEVSPQMREYERFNTVCANAFIKPLMSAYLTRLAERMRDAGAACPLVLMHSGGGIIAVETAVRFPVRLLESGPAGGAIFAAHLAERHGIDRALSFDMGGTTAKICLIEHAAPKTARTFEVARTTRFKKGSGMPISIPVIEMVEIGAGGGSIARVDAMRQIRVGPESAGSDPGPASYGRGGEAPTITDADLLLGKLDPLAFAGGTMALLPERAEAAMATVAEPLALSAEAAAVGIVEVVDETMASAARVHAVENGKDLAGFTMIAFGGAAPLHAARLAQKLGVGKVLVPPGAGVGSAIGFLRAPFAYEAVRGAYQRLSTFDEAAARTVLEELEADAREIVAAGGEGPFDIARTVTMRYFGQGWEITVALDDAAPTAAALGPRFEAAYKSLFGRALDGLDAEIMTFAVRVASRTPAPDRLAAPRAVAIITPDRHRPVFDPSAGEMVDAGVVPRDAIEPGAGVTGPAVIEERETTTIVPKGFSAVTAADGCLILEMKS